MKASTHGLLCTWVSDFKNDIRHHAAVVKLDGEKVKPFKIEPQKLDAWSRFDIGEYTRGTGGEYFPVIPLSIGNIGMVTTIQNSRKGRYVFTWWELDLN